MTGFFAVGSVLASLGLVTAIVMGVLGSGYHLMVALFSAVVAVSLHCLVFGIFTGAGKDTRELAQDLAMSQEYFEKIKVFRKTNFPPALYAILFLMAAIFLGGAVTVKPSYILGIVHGIFSATAVLYNLKVFYLEYRSIRDNAAILQEVNKQASILSDGKKFNPVSPEIELEPVSQMEWGTHVYALGKFMCFLGINMFLPYLYTRFIMGIISMPFWPYLTASIVLLISGYYLRTQYKMFQPNNPI